MQEVTKFQTSEPVVLKRSDILNAPYNPRRISDFAMKELRKNLKRVGFWGGVIVNKRTKHIIQGHQRLAALDTLERNQDYFVRVELVDVDDTTEIEQNIFMNSTTVQGEFDLTMLKDLIPQINHENAGLDIFDLNQMGVQMPKDMTIQVEEIASDFQELNAPVQQMKQAEREATAEEKKQAIVDLKHSIADKAIDKVENMDAYVTISFDTFENKANFMQRFGFAESDKFIKGEVFNDMVEVILG